MLAFYAVLFGLVFFLAACQKDDPADMQPNPDPTVDSLSFGLGWTGEDNLDEVPSATNFGFGNNNLPASADLGAHFPPIGNQGQYGTCVAWAVAYNGKTVLDGMDRGLSAGDLASAANQFSPKDLFTAIPDQQKAPDCNGTNFTFALDVLQERGVASMQTVPYTNLGDCSQNSLDPSWTQEASQNRIQYYRKIEPTVQSIKQNLANNIPVIFGARLADNFMTWNSDAVLSSSTTYNNVGQHAYHAMVISGYDDSKGPGGAFRVVNSWSEQ
jgi:C1A family cysteine protease